MKVGVSYARHDWTRQVLAYLANIANSCSECTRRDYCDYCDVPRAKMLIQRHVAFAANEYIIGMPANKDTLQARYDEILAILCNACTPLRTVDIRLQYPISRALKRWTLQRMVKKGLIRTTRVLNKRGKYQLAYYPTTTQQGLK